MKIYAILIVTLMTANALKAVNRQEQNIHRLKEAEIITALGAGLFCCLSLSHGIQSFGVPLGTCIIGNMFTEYMAHDIKHKDKKEPILARKMSIDFENKMHRD